MRCCRPSSPVRLALSLAFLPSVLTCPSFITAQARSRDVLRTARREMALQESWSAEIRSTYSRAEAEGVALDVDGAEEMTLEEWGRIAERKEQSSEEERQEIYRRQVSSPRVLLRCFPDSDTEKKSHVTLTAGLSPPLPLTLHRSPLLPSQLTLTSFLCHFSLSLHRRSRTAAFHLPPHHSRASVPRRRAGGSVDIARRTRDRTSTRGTKGRRMGAGERVGVVGATEGCGESSRGVHLSWNATHARRTSSEPKESCSE